MNLDAPMNLDTPVNRNDPVKVGTWAAPSRSDVSPLWTLLTPSSPEDLLDAPEAVYVEETFVRGDGRVLGDPGRLDPPDEILIEPPSDVEMWSYVDGDGRRFLQFSALSKMSLGVALAFLSFRGHWLMLLAPFALLVIAGSMVSLIWSTQIKPFHTWLHNKLLGWGDLRHQPVDVFIATCGEEPAIIDNTVWHAIQLDHPGGVNVFLLDDRNSEAVRSIAERRGVTYLTRPNRGWMKKAGNLHFAYNQTTSPLILVLDADFAVRRDFLRHTIRCFDDKEVGIVQTPQFFRVSSDNWVERGAAAQQEMFYRIGMRARDRRQAAICVGTNAVYRREALDSRGGMALLEHSEDIFTGMKVMDAGYRVEYLPLVLAAGSAPSTTASLASQQYRWARGNFALTTAPLFKRMHMTAMQRLSIWEGWIFYVTSALSPVVAVVVPVLTLAEAPHAISLAPTAMLLPALFTEFVVQPRWLHLPDGRASRRVGVISQVAHLYALRDHLTDRDQEWIPTGGVRTGKRRQPTDRIPDIVAGSAVIGFVTIVVMVGVRAAQRYSLLDLAPVVVLAAAALPTALATRRPPEPAADMTPSHPPTGGAPLTASSAAGASLSGSTATGERDRFLDTVRAVSIIRVLFWHALGYWWISWLFAAMPAVFYVSGAIFAQSIARASITTVVASRLKRLVVPYVSFLVVGLAAVALAVPHQLALHWSDALTWVVPYRSPAPLPWEAGWLSTPLWFIRALVFVMALAPVMVRIGRRLPLWVWPPLFAAAIVGLDASVAVQRTATGTATVRGVGDVVCFGGFFALGALAHGERHRMGRIGRLRLLAVLVATTTAITIAKPPPQMVVNNTYLSMTMVGLCWLVFLLTVEDHVRSLASIPIISRLVSWVTGSSMTIYLWHTLAVCVAYQLVGLPTSVADQLVLGAVFAVVLASLVSAVRPLEHIGRSRSGGTERQHRLHPVRIGFVMSIVILLATGSTLFPENTSAAGPPAPSGRPAVGGGVVRDAGSAAAVGDAGSWLRAHGATFAVMATISAGDDTPALVSTGSSSVIGANDRFEVLSVTKTMVATVAIDLAQQGRLDFDAPLPDIDGVDRRLTSTVTMRRLLAHASGLVDYREARDYRADAVLTPAQAIEVAFADSDTSSTAVRYSSANYLLAGLMIEKVTGESLADVLRTRLFEPLGLHDTEMIDNSRDGFVGYASGGVVSTVSDLSRWYDALMRRQVVLDAAGLDEMIWGAASWSQYSGLGAWRRCPCDATTGGDSSDYLYVFHDGGDVRIAFIPSLDTVVAIRLDAPIYGPDRVADDLDDLIFRMLDEAGVAPQASRSTAAPSNR